MGNADAKTGSTSPPNVSTDSTSTTDSIRKSGQNKSNRTTSDSTRPAMETAMHHRLVFFPIGQIVSVCIPLCIQNMHV